MNNRLEIALNPQLGRATQKRWLENIIATTDDADELNQAQTALEKIEFEMKKRESLIENTQVDQAAREHANNRSKL